MIEIPVILSLQITCIYFLFAEGQFLGWLHIWSANKLDKLVGLTASKYIQKPLWDCLPCMASIWTIVLTESLNWKLILVVCGINVLIDKLLSYERIIDG